MQARVQGAGGALDRRRALRVGTSRRAPRPPGAPTGPPARAYACVCMRACVCVHACACVCACIMRMHVHGEVERRPAHVVLLEHQPVLHSEVRQQLEGASREPRVSERDEELLHRRGGWRVASRECGFAHSQRPRRLAALNPRLQERAKRLPRRLRPHLAHEADAISEAPIVAVAHMRDEQGLVGASTEAATPQYRQGGLLTASFAVCVHQQRCRSARRSILCHSKQCLQVLGRFQGGLGTEYASGQGIRHALRVHHSTCAALSRGALQAMSVASPSACVTMIPW